MMSAQTQKQATSRMRQGLKLLLATTALITVTLGALIYWRPVATINAVQSGLLRLGGIKSKYAQIGPYRIHYLVGGDGPPLLLLHGHPGQALEWGPILPQLARVRHFIAIDLLGYGNSDAPDVDYTVATQTETVSPLLDVLGIPETDMPGFSMGGWVALKFAADHPDCVRRLMLVDSAGLKFSTPITAESYTPKTLAEFRELEKIQSNRRLPDYVARDVIRIFREKAMGISSCGGISPEVPGRS
jgi:pimeloyl-ACP methyl ester carboxylesterase